MQPLVLKAALENSYTHHIENQGEIQGVSGGGQFFFSMGMKA
jgi:hypothetical protein